MKAKQIVASIAIIIAIDAESQIPEKMSYQSVVRNSNNSLVINKQVIVKISILQGSIDGNIVLEELHNVKTNSNGLMSLEIGTGDNILGSFSSINWERAPFFIKVELDIELDNNFLLSGSSELLSVPFALYAKKCGNEIPGPKGNDGEPGKSGFNTLVKTFYINNEDRCKEGGLKIYFGLDTNENEILDTNEINHNLTKYLCNGIKGDSGNIGKDGLQGLNSLILFDTLFSGKDCKNGGVKIYSGIDFNNNGRLDSTEINLNSAQFICNGEAGIQGPVGKNAFVHYIGEHFGGGVIFHLYKDKDEAEHGLIVSLNDLSNSSQWGLYGTNVKNCESVWNGKNNTQAMIAAGSLVDDASTLCVNYKAEGYNDWYLPSIQELNLLWKNLYDINKSLSQITNSSEIGFNHYWSSTEYNSSISWFFYFNMGYSSLVNKSNTKYVRAVRAF